jgi:ketopantoate reductase
VILRKRRVRSLPLERGASLVSFQNGVEKDDVLRKEFGDEPVMGGVCYVVARCNVSSSVSTTEHDRRARRRFSKPAGVRRSTRN